MSENEFNPRYVEGMLSLATASANNRIKLTENEEYYISTVRLAIDHSFGVGTPQLYETMVFEQPFDGNDIDMARYETKEAALGGHEKLVEKYITIGR